MPGKREQKKEIPYRDNYMSQKHGKREEIWQRKL